jgi:hypothetical protein
MICGCCSSVRPDNDFFNNKKKCYQCIYKEKMEKPLTKRYFCKFCEMEFVPKKQIWGRPKVTFCSNECAKEKNKKDVKNYWTNQCKGKATMVNFFQQRKPGTCRASH